MPLCQVDASPCDTLQPMHGSPDICVGFIRKPTSSTTSLAISISNFLLPLRTSASAEEVRRYRQRANQSKDQPEHLSQSRFNTLSSLTLSLPKPINKSLSLFFFHKGSSRTMLHGSPMIIQLLKSDRVENWQEYLQCQVQDHPAWKSFPNIKTLEIDPRKPICVGYWEGGNSLPNANELIGSGSIAELLNLVENSKSSIILPQHGGNKGRIASESIRVGYTVHIWIIGDESDDEAVEDNVLLVASSPPLPPPPPPAESTRVRGG
ncbi:hypothetical protein HOY82DRAFT_541339 [Tuber indicum]|nr:hypothetical protein HOY82DRAFT_541339 [Tuber indicum]